MLIITVFFKNGLIDVHYSFNNESDIFTVWFRMRRIYVQIFLILWVPQDNQVFETRRPTLTFKNKACMVMDVSWKTIRTQSDSDKCNWKSLKREMEMEMIITSFQIKNKSFHLDLEQIKKTIELRTSSLIKVDYT